MVIDAMMGDYTMEMCDEISAERLQVMHADVRIGGISLQQVSDWTSILMKRHYNNYCTRCWLVRGNATQPNAFCIWIYDYDMWYTLSKW